MMSPGEFAARLSAAADEIGVGLVAPTETLMKSAEVKAKAVLGTYAYGWPQLSEYTIANGNPNNTPGFRTGAMRDSVAALAAPSNTGAEGLVYSGMVEALWFEMGTVTQPPRSFLYRSLVESIPEAGRLFSEYAVKIFAGIGA